MEKLGCDNHSQDCTAFLSELRGVNLLPCFTVKDAKFQSVNYTACGVKKYID